MDPNDVAAEFQKAFPKNDRSFADIQEAENSAAVIAEAARSDAIARGMKVPRNANPLEKHGAELKKSKLFFEKIKRDLEKRDLEFMDKMVGQQMVDEEEAQKQKEQIQAEMKLAKERVSAGVKAIMDKEREAEAKEMEVHKLTELARNAAKEAKQKANAAEALAAAKAGKSMKIVDEKLQMAKDKYVNKMRGQYIKRQVGANGKPVYVLTQINALCVNHCLDNATAECWAHDGLPQEERACPFIHRGAAGWDSSKCAAVLAEEARKKEAKNTKKQAKTQRQGHRGGRCTRKRSN